MSRLLCLLPVLSALTIVACADDKVETNFPKGAEIERKESRGKLTGEAGLNLFGGGAEEEAAKNASPLGVNGFLWRATLDTLAFMPLVSADPFGGTIITDWYEDPKTPGERYKVNALILDKSLRADGVKLTVFKQKWQNNAWRDQPVDTRLGRKLEDTVLTRARQLRMAQLGR